jgi:hypothetical protein
MSVAVQIVGWWILLSCVVGPCLTWAFFRTERLAGDEPAGHAAARHDATVVYFNKWAMTKGLRRPI